MASGCSSKWRPTASTTAELGVVDADPDEAVVAGVGLLQRRLELDAPATALAGVVQAAVDDRRPDLLRGQLAAGGVARRGLGAVAAAGPAVRQGQPGGALRGHGPSLPRHRPSLSALVSGA